MAHDPTKLAYWTAHQQSWQNSGLSQRKYCQREGLSYASFNHWRRRAPVLIKAATPTVPSLPKPTLTLVPAQLDPTIGMADIHLRSPAGWHITLPATLGGNTLAQLLSQLP